MENQISDLRSGRMFLLMTNTLGLSCGTQLTYLALCPLYFFVSPVEKEPVIVQTVFLMQIKCIIAHIIVFGPLEAKVYVLLHVIHIFFYIYTGLGKA